MCSQRAFNRLSLKCYIATANVRLPRSLFKSSHSGIHNIVDIAPQSPVRQCRTGRGCGGQLPFEVRARDQIRLKVLPSSSANRLAKIGALKLGSSSLIER